MTLSNVNFHSFTTNNAKGQPIDMSDYKGKVVLVVNVASKCGFAPQYTGLESLYQQYKDQGLVIIGFPCNQFGNQEPGQGEEIAQFCSRTWQVTFPIMEKVEVNGENEHPLWAWLKGQQTFLGLKRVKWNFEKFLVDKEGNCVKRYASTTTPEAIAADIKKMLV